MSDDSLDTLYYLILIQYVDSNSKYESYLITSKLLRDKCAVRPIRYRFLIKDAGYRNLSKLVGEQLLRVVTTQFA